MNKSIVIAPTLADHSVVVIYRSNGDEITVKLHKEKKTLASEKKLTIEEVNFIKVNFL